MRDVAYSVSFFASFFLSSFTSSSSSVNFFSTGTLCVAVLSLFVVITVYFSLIRHERRHLCVRTHSPMKSHWSDATFGIASRCVCVCVWISSYQGNVRGRRIYETHALHIRSSAHVRASHHPSEQSQQFFCLCYCCFFLHIVHWWLHFSLVWVRLVCHATRSHTTHTGIWFNTKNARRAEWERKRVDRCSLARHTKKQKTKNKQQPLRRGIPSNLAQIRLGSCRSMFACTTATTICVTIFFIRSSLFCP